MLLVKPCMGKFRCFYITRCLFSILHHWSKILTRGYFLHYDKFSMLLKCIRFFKGTKTQIFSRLFTFLCDRVMFQSVMTANCPLYIYLPIRRDINKGGGGGGGFPKKLWDHKCLLTCFLGATPPFPQTWNDKATLFQNEADLWPHVDTQSLFPYTVRKTTEQQMVGDTKCVIWWKRWQGITVMS